MRSHKDKSMATSGIKHQFEKGQTNVTLQNSLKLSVEEDDDRSDLLRQEFQSVCAGYMYRA